jgi:hypothetical protein
MFRRGPGVFMDVSVLDHPGLNNRTFLCAKYIFLTPLSLHNLMQTYSQLSVGKHPILH